MAQLDYTIYRIKAMADYLGMGTVDPIDQVTVTTGKDVINNELANYETDLGLSAGDITRLALVDYMRGDFSTLPALIVSTSDNTVVNETFSKDIDTMQYVLNYVYADGDERKMLTDFYFYRNATYKFMERPEAFTDWPFNSYSKYYLCYMESSQPPIVSITDDNSGSTLYVMQILGIIEFRI